MISPPAIAKQRTSPDALLRQTTPGEATPRHAVIALPAEERRVCDVRRFTAAVLSQWAISRDDTDSVLLIVSELAGNSAQHGHTDLAVLLTLHGCVIAVEVADAGPARAHHATASGGDDEHGRGLDIVAALADNWQTYRCPSGWRTHVGIRVDPAPDTHRARPEGTWTGCHGRARRAVRTPHRDSVARRAVEWSPGSSFQAFREAGGCAPAFRGFPERLFDLRKRGESIIENRQLTGRGQRWSLR
ncbi:anti-sigma regulatory factor (Ser/Thr protein kinase) [Streptomyces sp. V4I23]|uniref:ATP-binding protein n=1 Tax=Streptomyces sp. V4I23 TaxID=3042282 RepID=UPI002783E408|nr:anti-sigma regulatory factor (Ser/Thr protein kinase) [Streptomyces sp. V4I23]